jgi:TAT (twin-arginine translocation) pathway signal sequence
MATHVERRTFLKTAAALAAFGLLPEAHGSGKIAPILDAYDGPIILYHPVGASHQLPPAKFRTAKRVQYIHAIEHWDALERGLRSVHTKVRMRQSRLLRVSGRLKQEADDHEAFFDMPIHGVPAGHFNDLFDSTEVHKEMRRFVRREMAGRRAGNPLQIPHERGPGSAASGRLGR